MRRGLIVGSGDNKIAIWDVLQPGRDKSVSPIHKLDAKSFGTPSVVSINPRTALLATASTELVIQMKSELIAGIMATRCIGYHKMDVNILLRCSTLEMMLR